MEIFTIQKKFFALSLLLLVSSTFVAQVSYEEAFPNVTFNFPTEIQNANDGSNRLFVVEQPGTIKVFTNTPSISNSIVTDFLDISSKVAYSSGQEIGLLGMAFHPNFSSNGYVFLYYTDKPGNYRINVSRYQISSSNPNVLDPNSEKIIFQFEKNQANSNHNGGKIAFGPDGYLYASLGDGGGGGDPQGNGQNLNTVFGSILRIDVDIDGSNPIENNPDLPNGNYEIPSDNPRVGQSGLDELYAWGIRNTWKFSFDNTGKLWGADVGQNAYEEINLITKGGNYGWNRFEATSQPSYGTGTSLATTPDIKPIFFYDHSASDVSITGGYVYNGSLTSALLQNRYIYGDYVSGRVWSLSYDPSNGTTNNELLFKTNGQFISSFGEDEAGELYFSDYGASAKLYKLTETSTGPVTSPVDGIGEWKSIASGTNGIVETVVKSQNDLCYVGGTFSMAGDLAVNNIAVINTNGIWETFTPNGSNGTINSIAVAPDGKVYVAGDFSNIGGVNANNIAFWNGNSWNTLGPGTNGLVSKIKFNANGALYVGGVFTNAGGLSVNNIAKWENTSWSPLTDSSTGISGTNNEIRSIAFDENNIMYVGGNFDTAGGIPASRIASWNGSNWDALGAGTSGFVQAIESIGNYVYAGGNFSIAGNQTVNRIARYNKSNQTWEALGNGLSGNVNSIKSNGSFIYAGGSFETASDDGNTNKIVNNVARWSAGLGWQALGPNTNVGVNTIVNTLEFTKNDTELIVGGNFSTAGNLNTNNVAIWAEAFCSETSIIPEYQINGVWQSGSNNLTVQEGDNLTLSILPNTVSFTITLPDGSIINGDHPLGNTTVSQSGTYILETSQGCLENLELTVSSKVSEDDDNDGVANADDDCPNTPVGEAVNSNGCSNSQLDEDSDGVSNTDDDCPNTPVGEAVNSNGCSNSQLDDDNDGVSNADDLCNNTPVGETVDSFGCGASQSDLDNDGVSNSDDLCNDTPVGESVNEDGCSLSQLDDDGDGVPNNLDECPKTPANSNVDAKGCTLSSFPIDQFTISTISVTCNNLDNGSIDIISKSSETFTVTIIGENFNKNLDFTDRITISDLSTGEYEICFTNVNNLEYEFCTKANIRSPEPLEVESILNGIENSVTLKMKGSSIYNVVINDVVLQTEKNEITILLDKDVNFIKVSSDVSCLDAYEEVVLLENTMVLYPNPVKDFLNIDISNLETNRLLISLYSGAGKLILSKIYTGQNKIITLPVETLVPGTYFLRIEHNASSKSYKIVKL
ncbi:PQQ-dependent sugar dehydrogenase [Maribacter sp. CXY002]|uniref:PQQ-dependent sugar dehydrogenase n=1 Tax=Maribacter luteocoastalis TaxID=3407671 RepID=UPI003B67B27C